MVLTELGMKLAGALKKLNTASVIDENTLNDILKDIGNALMLADIKMEYILKMRNAVKEQVNQIEKEKSSVAYIRKVIQRTVVSELISLLDSKKKPYECQKGTPNVILFVGLQGSGKTTTCSKLAYYYKRKGWRVALVCADTFRAGAYAQLKQNSAKIKIPFYGSEEEKDPVKIAAQGVNELIKENFEIIIVDSSGKHKQESALFEEMKQLSNAIKPEEIIFVLDSSNGQGCYDQAKAFKKAVDIGSIIITKLDSHAKGGGALSAVAATQSPIIFLGSGEHFDDFEPFEAKSFVQRLLGLGDIPKLFKTVKDAIPMDKQKELMESIQKGKFSLRHLKEQFGYLMNMGPINQVMGMIPGLGSNLIPKGKEKESMERIKKFMYIMDSMTRIELDCEVNLDDSRIKRVAHGSGTSIGEVKELLKEHKRLAKIVEKMGKAGLGKGNDLQNMMRNPAQMMRKMQNIVDPRTLQQIGGVQNLMSMVQDFSQLEGQDKELKDMMKKPKKK